MARARRAVIRASSKSRIMRYELTDEEWAATSGSKWDRKEGFPDHRLALECAADWADEFSKHLDAPRSITILTPDGPREWPIDALQFVRWLELA